MKLKTEAYRGFQITYHVLSNGTFYSEASTINTTYFETLAEAEKDIKSKINDFLETVPKNYAELAAAIQNSLVWDRYEECKKVDSERIETIIESFISYRKSKGKL